ncbi:hypothetical protein AX774_g6395 [Zancudomyces culisetae]|uniref:RPA-interacting protein N-terminal domain-containing protein n=1 Tax=Zancudomyces culisetae TaxID=1213189 RepID=A0A1R1PH37_ZANCU|nr:hypothetical protein AX774_g6395 [Zancudomyces culisetae]|eukprot:OMH80172.1 hypothetical protein AX774_g6395 [Zancudomyces culisetae]
MSHGSFSSPPRSSASNFRNLSNSSYYNRRLNAKNNWKAEFRDKCYDRFNLNRLKAFQSHRGIHAFPIDSTISKSCSFTPTGSPDDNEILGIIKQEWEIFQIQNKNLDLGLKTDSDFLSNLETEIFNEILSQKSDIPTCTKTSFLPSHQLLTEIPVNGYPSHPNSGSHSAYLSRQPNDTVNEEDLVMDYFDCEESIMNDYLCSLNM